MEAAEDRAAELQRSMAASDSIQAQLQGSFTAQAALLDQVTVTESFASTVVCLRLCKHAYVNKITSD